MLYLQRNSVENMEYINILKKSNLFKGLSEDEINEAVEYSKIGIKEYKKGECIFTAGQSIKNIGLVLKGAVRIEKEDYYGNRSINTVIREGDIFGEVYACLPYKIADISVWAAKDSDVLMVKTDFIFLKKQDEFFSSIEKNLISILAQKAFMLNKKINHITKRTTREKLISYLSEQAEYAANNQFEIPFNRQELADYLCVDRSAMSSELSKMKKEGIIDFYKNCFKIKL